MIKSREITAKAFYLSIAIILLVIDVIWIFWAAPEIKKIPSDFTYSANLFSMDNFYDESLKKFEGEHFSKSMFKYHIIKKHIDQYVIENSFDVTTMSDKNIFSVTRIYFIDPYTWGHVSNRSGFLFAPRYVNKNDFTYWHVNYNAPGHMKFVEEEKIDGLTVYLYQAQYTADQTENLEHLPEVPTKRGVKTDVNLKLWIEPISGWLVKYQDVTQAYYYDRKTNKVIAPWNSFSNQYTLNSIHDQVKEAINLKWKILTVDFFIPISLLMLAVFSFWSGFRKKSESSFSFNIMKTNIEKNISFLISMGLLLIALLVSGYFAFENRSSSHQFVIGISIWNNSPDLLEAVQGFKDGLAENGFIEGKNIKYIIKNPNSNIKNQINILQSFIDKKANIIFTLTTPGTIIAKGITNQIPIIFADVTYPIESNLIASLKSSNNNLVGTRNYISPAEQYRHFENFYPHTKRLGFVHRKGNADSEIQYQEFKSMLSKRKIDVIDIAAVDLNDLRQKLQQNNYDSIYLSCDTIIQEGGGEIVAEYSLKNKIPSFSCEKNSVKKGALTGYIAELYVTGKLAGKKAALILKGADPKWLHTEGPTKGYSIINLPTANLLGIPISNDMLKNADYVIEK